MNNIYKLNSKYEPKADQINAIEHLASGIENNIKNQILFGVTGSGKTFTMANVIKKLQRPALIMVHNKTLAAQLYDEMKEFFPHNAVEYFVSYYDYYQPEAYLPKKDLFIEKDSSINEEINLMRHSATKSILTRKDCIIISTISSIYGLGSPETYQDMSVKIKKGQIVNRNSLIKNIVDIQYNRNDYEFDRGNVIVIGESVFIIPPYSESTGIKISFFDEEIEEINIFDIITKKNISELEEIIIFPNAHYVTSQANIKNIINPIREELNQRINFFKKEGKIIEADRIEKRVKYDLEMLLELGHCKGIENYCSYIMNQSPELPPKTMFDYIPKDAILFVDESHVTVPQIGAMSGGDFARKKNLIEHGFRLESAYANRPLKFPEWDSIRPNTIFVSATPGVTEMSITDKANIVEQIIRPTGLLDPICEIRPSISQVDNVINEIQNNDTGRTIIIALTKKSSENLNDYLKEIGIKTAYLHSEINTIERIQIINLLRKGDIDVLIGINLLREGIDIPECNLVAILDADKEGFLRSETSLIQIIGRAARNSEGRVILYADKVTNSIEKAVKETSRRRKIQQEYNKKNNITPQTIMKNIKSNFSYQEENEKSSKTKQESIEEKFANKTFEEMSQLIVESKKKMLQCASDFNFADAQSIKEEIEIMKKVMLKL